MTRELSKVIEDRDVLHVCSMCGNPAPADRDFCSAKCEADFRVYLETMLAGSLPPWPSDPA